MNSVRDAPEFWRENIGDESMEKENYTATNAKQMRHSWRWVGTATILAGAVGLITATAAQLETTATSVRGVETIAEVSTTAASFAVTEERPTAVASKPAQDNSIRPFHFHASDEA